MSIICTSLTVRTQPSPRFHVKIVVTFQELWNELFEYEKKLKIQDGGRLSRHLCGCGCHGNQFTHHVVLINWKYKESSIYVPNIESIGWMVSKVKGRVGLPPPPPHPMPSCSFLGLCLLWLIIVSLWLTGKNADSIDKLTILRIIWLRVSRPLRSSCAGMGSRKQDFFASGRMLEYNSSIVMHLNWFSLKLDSSTSGKKLMSRWISLV